MRDFVQLNVLVGCEESGVVRDEFLSRGHDAWSCDLEPAATPSNRHIRGDIREVIKLAQWDLVFIAHPPCTRLCNSGVRWLIVAPPGRTLTEMWDELREAAALFSEVWNADVPHIAVENPVMHKHAKALIRNFTPASQTVQPWWFGEPAFKATGLYLRGLPKLIKTNPLIPPQKAEEPERHKEWSWIHHMPPGPTRSRDRARTFKPVASAMADQWGDYAMAAKLERLRNAA